MPPWRIFYAAELVKIRCARRAQILVILKLGLLHVTASRLSKRPRKKISLHFIVQHLRDPAHRAIEPLHGMPIYVQEALNRGGFLRLGSQPAPSAVLTLAFQLAWRRSSIFRAGSQQAPSNNPSSLHLQKSKRFMERTLIEELLYYLDVQFVTAESDNLGVVSRRFQAYRDCALLDVTFATGGRRRAEISDLMWGQVYELSRSPPGIQIIRMAYPA